MKRIYMDYASATPLDERVFDVMKPYFIERFVNPGAIYEEGVESKKVLEALRKKVAEMINAKPEEVIFTSGGTESNSLAILGTLNSLEEAGRLNGVHIITSNIEHPSVLEIFKKYEQKGLGVSFAPVNTEGIIDLNEFEKLVKPETIFCSIMYVNNEIGTIQPIAEISRILKKKSKEAIFHTDASQAPVYLNISVEKLGVDLMSLDGGKIYGPKSSGILFKRSDVKIRPVLIGGSQEGGLRPGTENLAQVKGFTKALELAEKEREVNFKRAKELQELFLSQLNSKVKKFILNGSSSKRLPNNINITIPNEDSEFLALKLDKEGVMVATKSTCISKSVEGSYVINALGGKQKNGLRFSFGKYTTKEEVEKVVKILAKVLSL